VISKNHISVFGICALCDLVYITSTQTGALVYVYVYWCHKIHLMGGRGYWTYIGHVCVLIPCVTHLSECLKSNS